MGLSDIETIPETGAVFTIGRSRFADNVASHFFIRKDPVISVTCGDEHSAVICQSGRLFVFGSNDWGQLGLGHKNHVSKPSCVKSMKPDKVTHVACGRAHTLICTGAQKIFACGSDQEAQLGRGSSAIGDSSSTPTLVYDCGLTGPKVVQIAAGSHHSLALTSDGGVVAWGSNLEGQLGLPGTSGLVNKPTKVQIPEPVKEISTGYYHSAFLTESGLIYVCGESESGKLGIDVNFSTQVAPKQMQLPSPAIRVVCGGHHTLILAENGNLYCAGSNVSGQLGLGSNVTEVQTPKLLPHGALQNETISQIACGESHSAVLTESGKLFTCGDGRHGKLGLEENENNVDELTFAEKYQELYVSNVACGGCHTILVGRRRESNNQTQREMETTQTEHIQKKNPLPPLKLPVNRLQNESPEKKAVEKGTTEIEQEKSNSETTTKPGTDNNQENLENNQANIKDIATDSMNNIESKSPTKTSEEVTNKTSSMTNENIESTTTETKEEQTPENTETEAKVDSENNVLEEGRKEDEKTSGKEKEENEASATALINKEDNKEDNEENKQDAKEDNIKDNKEESKEESTRENLGESTEGKKPDVTSLETESKENGGKTSPKTEVSSPGPTPPPKPPRLKPGSGGSVSSDRKSSMEQEQENSGLNKENNAITKEENEAKLAEVAEHTNGSPVKQESSSIKSSSSSKKTSSAKSRVDTHETIEIDKRNTDAVDGKDKIVTQENANHEAAQDDADVVQSPVRRTSKVSKLFKPKKQQEIENGTKAGGTTSHKPKSKTCTVL